MTRNEMTVQQWLEVWTDDLLLDIYLNKDVLSYVALGEVQRLSRARPMPEGVLSPCYHCHCYTVEEDVIPSRQCPDCGESYY